MSLNAEVIMGAFGIGILLSAFYLGRRSTRRTEDRSRASPVDALVFIVVVPDIDEATTESIAIIF
jgi:hypothetical protein